MKLSSLSLCVLLFNMCRESVARPIKGSIGFKLPRPLTGENSIVINGTMITQKNILSVALTQKGGNHLCQITYDASKDLVSMMSELPVATDSEFYSTNDIPTPVDFSLLLEPKDLNSMHSIYFHLEVDNSGPIWLTCETKSFDTINRIVVKGAETVNSLLFRYKT